MVQRKMFSHPETRHEVWGRWHPRRCPNRSPTSRSRIAAPTGALPSNVVLPAGAERLVRTGVRGRCRVVVEEDGDLVAGGRTAWTIVHGPLEHVRANAEARDRAGGRSAVGDRTRPLWGVQVPVAGKITALPVMVVEVVGHAEPWSAPALATGLVASNTKMLTSSNDRPQAPLSIVQRNTRSPTDNPVTVVDSSVASAKVPLPWTTDQLALRTHCAVGGKHHGAGGGTSPGRDRHPPAGRCR